MKQKQYKVVGVKAVEYNNKYTIEIWIQASAHILADIGNVYFENNNKELLRSAYNGDCFHVVQFAGDNAKHPQTLFAFSMSKEQYDALDSNTKIQFEVKTGDYVDVQKIGAHAALKATYKEKAEIQKFFCGR